MPALAVKAVNLFNQYGAALANRSEILTEFDLRRLVRLFEAELKDAPDMEASALLYTLLGMAYQRLNRHKESLDAYKNAGHYDGESARSKINTATALIDLDRCEEALEIIRQLKNIKECKDDYILFANEAEAHYKLGNHYEAGKAIRRATALVEASPDAESMFMLATQMAAIEHDHDAVEMLARCFEAKRDGPLDTSTLAIDVVRQASPWRKASISQSPALQRAVDRVSQSYSGEDEEGNPSIELTSEEIENLFRKAGIYHENSSR